MKKILHLAVALFISIVAFAQKGSKISYNSDTIDYGVTAKSKDNGVRVFEFTNSGDTDLVISDVKSTCGCIIANKPSAPIKPGATGKIEIKYDMHVGPFRKTVTIYSNAVNVPDGVLALKIKGEVAENDQAEVLDKKKTLMDKKQ